MNINKYILFNIATMLTLCGILLFNLGWIYWTSYFKTLNIDSSFVDLSFDRIISTTWYYVLFASSGFYFAFNYIIKTRHLKKINLLYAIGTITDSISFLLFINKNIDYVWFIIIVVASIVLSIISALILIRFKIPQFILPLTTFKYIVIITIYGFSLFFYFDLGKKHATKFLNNYTVDTELTMTRDSTVVVGKFIVLMKNKYFLLVKNNGKKEIHVYNENEVFRAKIFDLE